MKKVSLLAPFVAAVVAALSGAGTEVQAQYSRRTPIVEAVYKTKASIVTIKVEKRGHSEKLTGTGVIVDDRGYVVSNCHVVGSAGRVYVGLDDGSELPAQVVTADEHHDLAILHVRSDRRLPALPLGPGSDLLVGETVIAVGHPYGYTNTVSTGIVSAVGREITMPNGEVLTNLIQTNASINPGNSGGPLLNINGELIGINVALREGAQGIAFAINAETVKQVLSQRLSALQVSGVEHGLVCGENVAPEGAHRQHVIVEGVGRQTPAAAAGMKPGDEIVCVAAQPVTNRFDLERALWDRHPGEEVRLTFVRQGKEITVGLKLTPASGSMARR
jgi:serine protease Do